MAFDIHPDIRLAETPPASWYLDVKAFDDTVNSVFAKSWQFLGDTDSLKAPGTAIPVNFLDGMLEEPLLLTRDRNDVIHCISNVCTHRGNLVCEGPTVETSLRCRYHGRKFSLDGTFQFMPEFDGVQGFPCEADNLKPISHGILGKWLFASLQPAASFEEVFGPIMNRVGFLNFPAHFHSPAKTRDYTVRAHWALYVDNYLEGFHIPYIHADLNSVLDFSQYTYETWDHGVLQLGIGKSGEPVFDLPEGHPDAGKLVSAYYYWVFPNLMLNFYPWGLSINVVKPMRPDFTRVSFIGYIFDESKIAEGAGGALDRVEREDEAIVELVQKGMQSRIYHRGRYSPKHEIGTHHFHRLLSQAIQH